MEQEKAHLRYNESRDALATALLAGSAYSNSLKQSLDAPREDTQRVKEIAELLWEFENKRDGKADEDWFHAEKIIRRAKTLESVEDADLQEVLR